MRFNWFKRSSKNSARHLELGEIGEQWAAKHLRRLGYKILTRRFRSRSGEIDLVARHNDWLVFVEVKTRRSEDFGAPSDAVDERKKRHISRVALDYLRMLDHPRVHYRFDIVEVVMSDQAGKPRDIRLIQNAFDLSEPYVY